MAGPLTEPGPIWDCPAVTSDIVSLHALLIRMLHQVEMHALGECSEAEMWAHLERGILVVARMHQAEHLIQSSGQGDTP